MAEQGETRVAVYLDFDNIVISRYDQVHGRNSFQRDRARGASTAERVVDPAFAARLQAATVDIGAVIDFASSFGTLVLTRAYADWSASVNAAYRGQLVSRAVDLVQLFPTAAYAKNGADIRLAVDAVEDMFRLPDLSHVVIVAGDSDYIALAQRCRRLGRYVVGIGVAGSTSRSLAAACDELVTYDDLPGIAAVVGAVSPSVTTPAPAVDDQAEAEAATEAEAAAGPQRGRRRRRSEPGLDQQPPLEPEHGDPNQPLPDQRLDDDPPEDPQAVATDLLERALRLGQGKDDDDWLHNSAVKTQMKRMDPSFSERALGFRSFSDFLRSRDELVDLDESSTARLVRLAERPQP
ncbi:NYN domain-containing protein [uncultured Amnibacterium sp.]|uniref:NYN domain-containing protein n=1 Tax=uncultured Amnibacterium sp. TaxID=1631851 RepID=UPI0035CBA047